MCTLDLQVSRSNNLKSQWEGKSRSIRASTSQYVQKVAALLIQLLQADWKILHPTLNILTPLSALQKNQQDWAINTCSSCRWGRKNIQIKLKQKWEEYWCTSEGMGGMMDSYMAICWRWWRPNMWMWRMYIYLYKCNLWRARLAFSFDACCLHTGPLSTGPWH